MPEDSQSFLRSCVAVLLQPLADYCVARGLRIQDFLELSKRAFVKSAERQLLKENKSASVSRLSVMTGIQRPDVNRILDEPESKKKRDFIARVVGQWSSDRRFTEKKKPKRLSIEGQNSQFSKLVLAVSSDLNPHTVRFELERLGLIETKDGYSTLKRSVYSTAGDTHETLRLGARDMADLLTAVQENAVTANAIPNLQARTEYDNVPDEALPEIRKWLVDAGSKLHEQARAFLSRFDRDINPQRSTGNGRNRVVIGTYSRTSPIDDTSED